MFSIVETESTMVFTRRGRLVPWLGRALRGVVGMKLKDRVCVESWRLECKGCPRRSGCAYGETVEADPESGIRFSGQTDATRPIVIAPQFPAPGMAFPGAKLQLRVIFAGTVAATHVREFWAAVSAAGADTRVGLGPDRVTFEVSNINNQRHTVELADGPGTSVVPDLRLVLTAPLLLRLRGKMVEKPNCADLLRASLHTLGALSRLYGNPEPDQSFGLLKEAAVSVRTASPTTNTRWRSFRQSAWSNRKARGAIFHGVVGAARFFDVPVGVATWLSWAGRLHVGSFRVAGAGGWRVAPD